MSGGYYSQSHNCEYCHTIVLDFAKTSDAACSAWNVSLRQSLFSHLTVTEKQLAELEKFDFAILDVNEKDLLSTADAGCEFCSILLINLRKLEQSDSERKSLGATKNSRGVSFGIIAVINAKDGPGIGWRAFPEPNFPNLSYHVILDAESPLGALFPSAYARLNLQPGSRRSISTYINWLRTCCTDHRECPKPSGTFTPTRLLEIYNEQGTISVRLNREPDSSPYAVLSYCWGGDQRIKLVRDNINQFSRGLDFSDLPATLKEAISLTSSLQIKFLWVDALCIVQDDDDDKDVEMATMQDVYGHAILTIAAARASSVAEGFLGPRHYPEPLVSVLYRTLGGDLQPLLLIPPEEAFIEHLDERGWTLQERLLSSRSLVFGKLQTRWACQTTYTSEYLVDGWNPTGGHFLYDISRLDDTYRKSSSLMLQTSRQSDLPPEFESIVDLAKQADEWHQLVQAYTHRSLKYPTDRLPAISGIATRYANIFSDEYCAGLWQKLIPWDLFWTVDTYQTITSSGFRSGKLKTRPVEYQGPSWSWACISDPVRFEAVEFRSKSDSQFLLSTCQVETKKAGAKYGAVTYASMNLRGRLLPARWIVDPALQTLLWPGLDASEYGPERARPAEYKMDPILHGVEGEARGIELPVHVFRDAVEQEFAETQYGSIDVCLLLVARDHNGKHKGLLLRRLPEEKYSRLGVFVFTDSYQYDEHSFGGYGMREEYKVRERWLLEAEPRDVTLV